MNEHESPIPIPPVPGAGVTDPGATDPGAGDLAIESLVMVVVGAHLRAELHDRPLAYRLRDQIDKRRQMANAALAHQPLIASIPDQALDPASPTVIVCTDLWYLNDHWLLGRPAICVGDPSVNAATAYLSNRLPTAFVIEDLLRIHLDPEGIDPQACVWGVNPKATDSALSVFIDRYLDGFLRDAAGCEP